MRNIHLKLCSLDFSLEDEKLDMELLPKLECCPRICLDKNISASLKM